MVSRFDQAKARIVDARRKFAILETDELEQVRAAGHMTPDFPIGVLNVLNSLRSALDRCANELFTRFVSPHFPKKKPAIHFPISPKGSPAYNGQTFSAWVNDKAIPKLNTHRPDLVALLESFQAHISPNAYGWLPDFARLTNKNKHEDDDPSIALSINTIVLGGGFFCAGPGQNLFFDCTTPEGTIHSAMVEDGKVTGVIDDDVSIQSGVDTVIKFDETGADVLPFLLKAINGVETIVEAIIAKAT